MPGKLLSIARQLKITRDFRKKLSHNIHELTRSERCLYTLFRRPFLAAEDRFYFEGERGLAGQMYMAERKVMYETIIGYAPRHCFEIGTYTGGGSTFFISSAFQKLNKGMLITLEVDRPLHESAVQYYERNLPVTREHIHFLLGSGMHEFDAFVRDNGTVDCVFFDGSEDGQQTLSQYRYFLPFFHEGSVILVHDWNTEKARLLKPAIMQDKAWKTVTELHPPRSVGLAVFERTSGAAG
jgi:predicted O-methyltransferase YrrM